MATKRDKVHMLSCVTNSISVFGTHSSGRALSMASWMILFTSNDGWKGPNALERALIATLSISLVLSPIKEVDDKFNDNLIDLIIFYIIFYTFIVERESGSDY